MLASISDLHITDERTATNASARQMTMTFAYAEDEDTDGKIGGPSLDVWAGIQRKQYALVATD